MTDFARFPLLFASGSSPAGTVQPAVTNPRIVPTANAVDSVKPPWRQVMKATGIESSLLLTRAG
jgi:hypothetical protein